MGKALAMKCEDPTESSETRVKSDMATQEKTVSGRRQRKAPSLAYTAANSNTDCATENINVYTQIHTSYTLRQT